MKFGLGYIIKNGAFELRHFLPKMVSSFDGIVAIDTGSTDDTRDVLIEFGSVVHSMQWNWNYSEARNALISRLTEAGYDATLMLDADEAMFPNDIQKVRNWLEDHPFVLLARVNFIGDPHHWQAHTYPDWQPRAFRLDRGIEWRNRVHEWTYCGEQRAETLPGSVKTEETPIYHYGLCGDRAKIWLRHHNYGLIQEGKPCLSQLPDGFDRKSIPALPSGEVYSKVHPLS